MAFSSIQFDKFKLLLDKEYSFPSLYTFKFIIREGELLQAQEVFAGESFELKGSSKGKYISITFTKMMNSSDEILDIYKRALIIPHIIAL